jgi:alcohol-forming fatty acyl-CoA reductase
LNYLVDKKKLIKYVLNYKLFDTLKSKNAEAIKKINIIEGDCMELRLGISDSDYEKLKRCSVIFHVAASVRFDDPLKKAVLLNTRGAREICELARNIPNLKSFVHVSTAYIQPKNFHVEEELYQPEGDWKSFIKYAENLDDDLIDKLTSK